MESSREEYDGVVDSMEIEAIESNQTFPVVPNTMVKEVPNQIKSFYPMINEAETPLPREWNIMDKHNCAFVKYPSKLQVYYKQVGGERGPSSIRASSFIPVACGIYYFEVKVVELADDHSNVAIGVSNRNFALSHYPGTMGKSWGLHGGTMRVYDGNTRSGPKIEPGPALAPGDVVGCCVNMVEKTLFFTRNGKNLNHTMRDICREPFPTVCLSAIGDVVEANFGQYEFVYDIKVLIESSRSSVQEKILTYPSVGDAVLNQMVIKYLVHHGYTETADALAMTTGETFDDIERKSIEDRKRILSLVLEGRIRNAIHDTTVTYPGLLDSDESLLFTMECREFVEMVNRIVANETARNQTSVIRSTNSLDESCGHIRKKRKSESTVEDALSEVSSDCNSIPTWKNSDYLSRLIDLGRELNKKHALLTKELKKEYQNNENNKNNQNGILTKYHVDDKVMKYEKMLEDICSLLPYREPKKSPVAWLLDPKGREHVYHKLNQAIVKYENLLPKRPVLDSAAAHSGVLLNLMSKLQMGNCGFVDATFVNLIKRN